MPNFAAVHLSMPMVQCSSWILFSMCFFFRLRSMFFRFSKMKTEISFQSPRRVDAMFANSQVEHRQRRCLFVFFCSSKTVEKSAFRVNIQQHEIMNESIRFCFRWFFIPNFLLWKLLAVSVWVHNLSHMCSSIPLLLHFAYSIVASLGSTWMVHIWEEITFHRVNDEHSLRDSIESITFDVVHSLRSHEITNNNGDAVNDVCWRKILLNNE